jgi:caffeoyl-CoA O-methyltransferase
MQRSLRNLYQYCTEHSSAASPLLYELERETHLKTLAPQMMTGPLQGQLLRFISSWVQPKYALEIGTFTGYGAICIAEGLPADGQLYTIEPNRELAYITRKYVEKTGLSEKIHLLQGRAEDIIPSLPFRFDLVLIDGGKQDYSLHYDLVIDKMNPRGIILVDNVLWDGKVTLEKKDKDTQLIHAFNEKVQRDERVENLLLPLRDGLMIMKVLA